MESSSTLFSAGGHLLQIEYALEAVKKGSSILAFKLTDAVILGIEEDSSRFGLLDAPRGDYLSLKNNTLSSSVFTKIFQVNHKIFGAFSGVISDGQFLTERLQLLAQRIYMEKDREASVREVAEEVSELLANLTLGRGVRPLGISIILFGEDSLDSATCSPSASSKGSGFKDALRMFLVDPSGKISERVIAVIGKRWASMRQS